MKYKLFNKKIRYEFQVIKVIGLKRYYKKFPNYLLKKFRYFSLKFFGHNQNIDELQKRYRRKSIFAGEWLHSSKLEINTPLFLKEKDEILKKAFKAKNGEFFINGRFINIYKNNKNGNWSIDPISGKIWPSENIFKPIKYFPGDLRFPWELDRMHHLILFGQAWRCSKDIIWPNAGIFQLRQLLNQNEFEYGIHWRDGLQLAIRIFSMIGFCDLCHDFNDDFHKEINPIIALHAYSLSRQISPESEITNNHIIGELCALALSGIYLNNKKYYKISIKKLQIELDRQIYNDGIPYEGSIPYIRFVLEFLMLLEIAIKNSKYDNQAFLINYIDKIASALSSLVDAKGYIPPIGDGDDGRVMKFDEEPYLNVNETLLIAGELTNKNLSSVESKYSFRDWVLGKKKSTFNIKKLNNIEYLNDSGLIHLNNKNYDLWIDCGPTGLGKYGPGGHGHNDTCSLVFYFDGQPILHDPGWYSYFESDFIRDQFRSTLNHNTISINNEEQARLGSTFQIFNECFPLEIRVYKNNLEFTIICGHNGFKRIDKHIKYKRIIKTNFAKNFELKVTDIVKSRIPILVTSHLGSNYIWNQINNKRFKIFENKFLLDFEKCYSGVKIKKKKYSLSNALIKNGSSLNWNSEYSGKNTIQEFIYKSRWHIYQNKDK